MRYLTLILLAGAILMQVVARAPVVHAGEPTGEIGPMNPTMFKCVSKDGSTLIQPDPFRKPLTKVFVKGGDEFELDAIEEILAREPSARESICTSNMEFDFGFDTEDAKQFESYLDELKRQCDDFPNAVVVPITDTRIEGFVFEFRPRNPNNLEATEWIGSPVKGVTVLAKGITFEIFWGTDDNGAYYFDNLGAGPILLNLQLPPDARMINPNVFIDSTGLDDVHRANLGFYRGDFKPDIGQLVTPDGTALPLLGLGDIEELSQCGVPDLPAIAASYEPPFSIGDTPAIPDVGGVLPPEAPLPITIIAIAVLVILPAASLVKMRNGGRKPRE